jgi:HlyD family secretion protein
VLVVRDGSAQRQPVKLGVRSEGKTEILEGLAPGDLLVPAKNISIREGSHVRAGAVQA